MEPRRQSNIGSGTAPLPQPLTPTQTGGLADEARALVAEETLLRTQNREASMQAEIDQLRRTMAQQDDKISQLTKDLRASREAEGRLQSEAEVARAETAQITEELLRERELREEAEAIAAEQQQMTAKAAALASHEGTPRKSSNNTQGTSWSGRSASLTAANRDRRNRRSQDSTSPVPELPRGSATPSVPPQFSGSASRRCSPNGRSPTGKDDIDSRLNEYLDRAECNIHFRRLNRGWYAFRRPNDDTDRNVEISVVNGRLLVRVEPSTHDPGWNNGKLGPIERFVSTFSSC